MQAAVEHLLHLRAALVELRRAALLGDQRVDLLQLRALRRQGCAAKPPVARLLRQRLDAGRVGRASRGLQRAVDVLGARIIALVGHRLEGVELGLGLLHQRVGLALQSLRCELVALVERWKPVGRHAIQQPGPLLRVQVRQAGGDGFSGRVQRLAVVAPGRDELKTGGVLRAFHALALLRHLLWRHCGVHGPSCSNGAVARRVAFRVGAVLALQELQGLVDARLHVMSITQRHAGLADAVAQEVGVAR